MKKVACLFLLLFALVQLAPAIQAVCENTTTVFVADEEKSEEKGNGTNNKEKKDYAVFLLQSSRFTQSINTAFHISENIHPSPCLEKLSPPPNFC